METQKFDRIVRQVSRMLSRRALVGGSLGAALMAAAGLDEEADARRRGRGQVSIEACIQTGKKCPSKKPRGKKKKNLSCRQCCQGYSVRGPRGRRKCACRPGGLECGFDYQCCSGFCEVDGTCADVCVPLGRTCEEDPDCCSGFCNEDLEPRICTSCRPPGGDCTSSEGGDGLECCSRNCIVDEFGDGVCA